MIDSCEDGDCCHIGGDLLRADLSAAPLEVAVAGFAAIWQGQAAAAEDLLPGRAGLAADVLDELAAKGRAELDDRRRVIGIHGLTLRTTRHRLEHAHQSHHTWCAFDTVGIAAALRLDATSHSDCRTCGRLLTVAIRVGVPDEAGFVLWLPAARGEHLMNEFCASADLYCSIDHLLEGIDIHRRAGHIAELSAAAELGRETWADVASVVTTEARADVIVPIDPRTATRG